MWTAEGASRTAAKKLNGAQGIREGGPWPHEKPQKANVASTPVTGRLPTACDRELSLIVRLLLPLIVNRRNILKRHPALCKLSLTTGCGAPAPLRIRSAKERNLPLEGQRAAIDMGHANVIT